MSSVLPNARNLHDTTMRLLKAGEVDSVAYLSAQGGEYVEVVRQYRDALTMNKDRLQPHITCHLAAWRSKRLQPRRGGVMRTMTPYQPAKVPELGGSRLLERLGVFAVC